MHVTAAYQACAYSRSNTVIICIHNNAVAISCISSHQPPNLLNLKHRHYMVLLQHRGLYQTHPTVRQTKHIIATLRVLIKHADLGLSQQSRCGESSSKAYLLSGRAAKLQTAPAWASTDCSLLEAPTSNTSRAPSLVPTTACLFPGANKAHRPYPASIVRRQAPDLGFQILTSLLEPDNSRESSLDSATVLMSERWPGESKPCRRATSSSWMCHTCSVDGAMEWGLLHSQWCSFD